jgi:hypothetical protein
MRSVRTLHPLGFLLALGAILRIIRFVVSDVLFAPVRAWVLSRWGLDSRPHTLVTCPACSSIWAAALVFGLWGWLGDATWLGFVAAGLSASYLVIILNEWVEPQ